MVNCKKCKLFLAKSKDDIVKCKGTCGAVCHKKCAKKLFLVNGRCEDCAQTPVGSSRESSVVNVDAAGLDAETALIEINKKIEIIYGMQKTLAELAESVDFYAEKYQELTQKQEKTEKKLTAMEQRNTYLEKYAKALEERIVILESKEYENKIEIAGLETQEGEKIENTVLNIAKKLDLDPGNVETAQRINNKQNGAQPNPVIITLKTKAARNQWIAKRKNRITNNDVYNNGNRKPIYINEVLTKSTRQLLWMTKKELNGIYKYIWVQDGKILVRKGDTERKIFTVRSEDFLTKLKSSN